MLLMMNKDLCFVYEGKQPQDMMWASASACCWGASQAVQMHTGVGCSWVCFTAAALQSVGCTHVAPCCRVMTLAGTSEERACMA